MKILDSRQLQERLEELDSRFATYLEELEDEERTLILNSFDRASSDMQEQDWREAWEGTSDGEEYANLLSLKDEIGGQWKYGVSLIAENDFEEYAQELAEDIGALNASSNNWPYTCIDWEKAAEELKQDYSTVDYDGETYYYRA